MQEASPDFPPERVLPFRLAATGLILGAAAIRLLFLTLNCPLDLAPDEAHYWDWSRHLDWSYYSKGPLVAYLIRLSCWIFGSWSEAVAGSQMVAVRIPAVVCGSVMLAGLYALTVQVFRREKLALGVVVLTLTLPIVSAGASLMTIDAPFTCCWAWALVFGFHAVFRQARWAWAAAGLCVGLGILAKYTMVLWVPSFALFLLCTPSTRAYLARPGFWILAGVSVLGLAPILIWNLQHDWITLRHAQGHAGIEDGNLSLRWTGPFAYVGLQFVVLLGYWFVAWAGAIVAHCPCRENRPEIRYLWFLSVPTFLFFGVFTLKNGGGEPNWPIAGYLSGAVLAAAWLANLLRAPNPMLRRTTATCVGVFAAIGLLMTIAVHHGRIARPLLAQLAGPPTEQRAMPMRRLDPTSRLRGWRTLALEVDKVREDLRKEGIEPILAASGWTLPGEIGFYCQGQPVVFSIGLALGDRHSQYDLWRPNPVADPADYLGRTFILVGANGDAVRSAFEHVEAPREVTHWEFGQPIARWSVTVCRGYKGLRPSSGRNF